MGGILGDGRAQAGLQRQGATSGNSVDSTPRPSDRPRPSRSPRFERPASTLATVGWRRVTSGRGAAPPPRQGQPAPVTGATIHTARRVWVDIPRPSGDLAIDPASVSTVIVGIDRVSRAREASALDATCRDLGRREFPATPEGLEALVAWMLGLAGDDPAAHAVAIERPDGLVVEALPRPRITVYAIKPKQLDRFTAAGAKDDRRDARVMAMLRTGRGTIRPFGRLPRGAGGRFLRTHDNFDSGNGSCSRMSFASDSRKPLR